MDDILLCIHTHIHMYRRFSRMYDLHGLISAHPNCYVNVQLVFYKINVAMVVLNFVVEVQLETTTSKTIPKLMIPFLTAGHVIIVIIVINSSGRFSYVPEVSLLFCHAHIDENYV